MNQVIKTFATVCSGIGAPEVAARSLGWRCLFGSEIEPFPNAVREHHFSGVPNYGDMNEYKNWTKAKQPDVIIAGTPCQAFSIAGLRKGLADPRGNLTLIFLGILARYTPRWVLWENVPGVLSNDGGQIFAAFLGGLAQLGYGYAYRILDAQYFGVAQRRRRVFVVGHFGGLWQRAAAVLFERESLHWNPAPSREAGKGIATVIDGRTNGSGENELIPPTLPVPSLVANGDAHSGFRDEYGLIAETVGSLTAAHSTSGPNAYTGNFLPVIMAHGQAGAEIVSDGSPSLTCNHEAPIGFIPGRPRMAVRRLTPRECERLQGFPDDYTLIKYRGKMAADSPRYKALGNSMAVPNIQWILQRMMLVDELVPLIL